MGYDSRLDRLAATSWYPFFNNVTARGEIMEPYSLTLDEACSYLIEPLYGGLFLPGELR